MDVEAPEINDKDWSHAFEAIDEWLHRYLGEYSKIHLAYVVCDNEAVTADPVLWLHGPARLTR